MGGRGVLEGAFALLYAVQQEQDAGVTALAEVCGLPKTTAYRLLDQLVPDLRRAVALGAIPFAADAGAELLVPEVLAGRDAELATLRGALDAARMGDHRAVELVGEPAEPGAEHDGAVDRAGRAMGADGLGGFREGGVGAHSVTIPFGPHPEEPRSGVSKDGPVRSGASFEMRTVVRSSG